MSARQQRADRLLATAGNFPDLRDDDTFDKVLLGLQARAMKGATSLTLEEALEMAAVCRLVGDVERQLVESGAQALDEAPTWRILLMRWVAPKPYRALCGLLGFVRRFDGRAG